MKAFISEEIGDTSTFDSELNEFVKLRNEAAHGQVESRYSFFQRIDDEKKPKKAPDE